MARIYNFSAGPSTLPLPALEEAADKLVDFEGTGMSLIEMSHRGKHYDRVHRETITMAQELLEIPEDYHVLFLQGGATLQFGMIPMAFLKDGKTADYVITGSWAKKALDDGKVIGNVNVAWDGKSANYIGIPSLNELNLTRDASYVHICSNETIGGIQWKEFPDTGNVPLVADMSSEIMTRPIPWNKLDLIYAGAQKNLAPSGMTLIVIKKSFLENARRDLPAYLRYDIHAQKDSLYNTPPGFSIWMANLTFKWIKSIGGIKEIMKRRDEKANMLYGMIDNSGGFYKSPVDKEYRSTVNIVWRLRDEELEKKFIEQANTAGLSSLKGHRSVGGIRASVYNAMPVDGVIALVDFMKDFMGKN